MKKFIRFLVGIISFAVLIYSSWNVYLYYVEVTASKALNGGLADSVVTVRATEPKKTEAAPREATEPTKAATEPAVTTEPAAVPVPETTQPLPAETQPVPTETEAAPAAPMVISEPVAEETTVPTEPTPVETVPPETIPEETMPPYRTSREPAPIEVDFDALHAKSEDLVGWLYCEGTPINLPVAQSDDNDYYLRRLIDGTGNNSGTLFVDYRNAKDLSDWNTVIYGHNMRNQTMFGSISNYRRQDYYEKHPVMWLLTPEANYKVELVAAIITPWDSDIYAAFETDEDALEVVRLAVENSTFKTELELEPGDHYLSMSTCSYEYDGARYVVIGRLVLLEEE